MQPIRGRSFLLEARSSPKVRATGPQAAAAKPAAAGADFKNCRLERAAAAFECGITAETILVGVTELESVTSCMSSKRSNQLSYTPGGGFRPSARKATALYDSRRGLGRQGRLTVPTQAPVPRPLIYAPFVYYGPNRQPHPCSHLRFEFSLAFQAGFRCNLGFERQTRKRKALSSERN